MNIVEENKGYLWADFHTSEKMFAIGHLSLGYLLAKGSARLLKQDVNLALIFLFSLLPDVDIIIPGVQHRTITHSIVFLALMSLPFFLLYKTTAIPYFTALAQHSLVGDFLTGGARGEGTLILWPISLTPYGLPIRVLDPINVTLEWCSFLVAIIVMLKTRDLQKLLKGQISHLSLSVPMLTVLLPSFLQFPLAVPVALLIPHLVYLVLFSLAIFNVLKSIMPRSV